VITALKRQCEDTSIDKPSLLEAPLRFQTWGMPSWTI
jgi:hypothetical protein